MPRFDAPPAFVATVVLLAGCGTLIGIDGLDFSSEGSGGSGGVGTNSTTTGAAQAGGAFTTTRGSGGSTSSATGGQAGVGGQQAGSGGAGGAPTADEICDGVDNDIDLVVDEGCPVSVTVTSGTFAGHGLYGNPTGDPFAEQCPDGSALLGFDGWNDVPIFAIRGICGALSLATDTTTVPHTFAINAGAEFPLPIHGDEFQGLPFAVRCAANEFVTGIEAGGSSNGLRAFVMHCSPLAVDKVAGTYEVLIGSTSSTLVGTATISFTDLLPAPKLVDRIRGSATSFVRQFGIGEVTVGLQLKPQ